MSRACENYDGWDLFDIKSVTSVAFIKKKLLSLAFVYLIFYNENLLGLMKTEKLLAKYIIAKYQ